MEEEKGYVFVGGLKATFTESILVSFFQKFGEIESIELKKNSKNKNFNKGYCTITFKTQTAAVQVINIKNHFIKNRMVTCRKFLKGDQLKHSRTEKGKRMIYISDIPPQTTNGDISELFSQFGKVEAGYTLVDQETGNSKGFGFVTFEQGSSMEKALGCGRELRIRGVKISLARFNSHRLSGEVDQSSDMKKEKGAKERATNANDQSPKERNNGGAMRKKNFGVFCKPELPSKLALELQRHQLRPGETSYHAMEKNDYGRSWHNINVENLKLRLNVF